MSDEMKTTPSALSLLPSENEVPVVIFTIVIIIQLLLRSFSIIILLLYHYAIVIHQLSHFFTIPRIYNIQGTFKITALER